MLWQPNLQVFQEMLAELLEPKHPEHCFANGPEQDYLSRFWADAPWHHIGVEYNFQIHHMFLCLHPDKARKEESKRRCEVGARRVRLLETPELIKVVHFSGEALLFEGIS